MVGEFDKLQRSGRATDLPCTLGGGSPSLHKVNPCITGPLLTKRIEHYCSCCSVTSAKPTCYSSVNSHRVERPNPEISTKAGTTTPLQFSDSSLHLNSIQKFKLMREKVA